MRTTLQNSGSKFQLLSFHYSAKEIFLLVIRKWHKFPHRKLAFAETIKKELSGIVSSPGFGEK